MKLWRFLFVFFIGLCLTPLSYGAPAKNTVKKRLLVVDSYHREYLGSQHINEGFCEAMIRFGYFANKKQAEEYTKKDYIETSTSVIQKVWMDSKRKNSKAEMEDASNKIFKLANDFKPDLIFLGDDNATKHIGKIFIDTAIPIVFWGVNNTPVKYGLLDSKERPGHNVTGIYQTTYYEDSLRLLKIMVPGAKTFAILSDATTTGRNHTKAIQFLARKGLLALELVETISTNDSDLWRKKALELQQKVDAFFVAHFSGLKDHNGKHVPDLETAQWYLTHIKIPETSSFRHRVDQGMLCAADDSAYNQGYDAVVVAHDILANKADPATYPPRVPNRGPLMVNRERVKMLGIRLTDEMGIEEYIEEASALRK